MATFQTMLVALRINNYLDQDNSNSAYIGRVIQHCITPGNKVTWLVCLTTLLYVCPFMFFIRCRRDLCLVLPVTAEWYESIKGGTVTECFTVGMTHDQALSSL